MRKVGTIPHFSEIKSLARVIFLFSNVLHICLACDSAKDIFSNLNSINMALIVPTSTPEALLKAIYTAIDTKTVETWSYKVFDGQRYFTHTPSQWAGKAWLIPKVYQGELRFGIVKNNNETTISKVIYGVYHGRFIEMLLTHFDNSFDGIRATAQVQVPDLV